MALTIEGPIPGGDLPPCNVLRCGSEAAYLATVRIEATGDVTERLLCAAHANAIQAGEPWRWDDDQMIFLMGADRLGGAAQTVTSYRASVHNGEIDSVLGYRPVSLTLEVSTGADGETEPLYLQLKASDAAQLGRMLVDFGLAEPESGDGDAE